MDAVILINQGGGAASRDPAIGATVEAAVRAAGIMGEIELLDGAAVASRATEAVAAGASLIIAGGGDGTISAVAGAIVGSNARLGLLPLGTLNHLARDLGIPADLTEAAAIIAAGHAQAIDVAELNGRTFVNNSAIGLYPLMVLDRDAQQRRLGRSKRLALLVASIRTFARFRHARLVLTINDSESGVIDTPLLFVGNNDYALGISEAGTRKSLTDGRLCVLVLRKKGRLGLLAASLRALAGWTRDDDMVQLDGVTRLRVAGRRSRMTVSLDGETISMDCPLDYAIRPASLSVLTPPPAPPASSTG